MGAQDEQNWVSSAAIFVESLADVRYTAKQMLSDHRIIPLAKLFRRFLSVRLIALDLAVLFCLVPNPALNAQERVRTAAEKLEIESFRKPEFNLELGPLQELLSASVGVEYTDNSNLSHLDKISRFSIIEGIGVDTIWVLSHLNELRFNFGARLSEDFYGNGKNQINVGISPNSRVQFQFAVSDFRVRLYDQFSYVQDPTANPTATNTTTLNSLTNTLGTIVDADFNLAILSLSADYTYNNQSGANETGPNNPSTSGTRNSFRVGSSVSFRWSPTVLYGIEDTLSRSTGSSGTTTSTKNAGSGNVNSLNVGPFIRGKLSRLTDFDLGVGATLVDAKPSVAPTYYLSAVVRHQLNRNWQLILSGSHDLVFTTGTNLTEETVLRASTAYKLTRFVTFTAAPYVIIGDVKNSSVQGTSIAGSSVQGSYKQYVIETTLDWNLRKHLTAGLTYDFKRLDQKSAAATYSQNSIAFHLSYAF
jgi:hypothetical protein